MKSINKTKNDSISEQASVTKEEMIEFASKYKNIEAFKDFDDETTYWFIMLFILLMYIDYNTQKLWESFAEEVKTKNRFFPESELLKRYLISQKKQRVLYQKVIFCIVHEIIPNKISLKMIW